MEGLTEEQKAFRIRKMKTRFRVLDVNRNGFVSTEDFDELAKRFIEKAKLSGEQVTRLQKSLQVCFSKHSYVYSSDGQAIKARGQN